MPQQTSRAASPGCELGAVDGALAPAVVHPGGHRRVHQVVDAGDPVEHAADLGGELLRFARRLALGGGQSYQGLEAGRFNRGRVAAGFVGQRGIRVAGTARTGGLGHLLAVERAEEGDEIAELLRLVLGHGRIGRHDARPDLERARDRGRVQAGADLGQLRAGPVVAVLAELVAGEAARLGGDQLAGLELRGRRRGRSRSASPALAPRKVRKAIATIVSRPGDRRDRALQRVALRVAVVERQQEEQHHRDRRDADRRDRDELVRLDHPQQLEEEEEVPLGPRHVGGRGRVGLRALLGAEPDRHRDDHAGRRSAPSSSPS